MPWPYGGCLLRHTRLSAPHVPVVDFCAALFSDEPLDWTSKLYTLFFATHAHTLLYVCCLPVRHFSRFIPPPSLLKTTPCYYVYQYTLPHIPFPHPFPFGQTTPCLPHYRPTRWPLLGFCCWQFWFAPPMDSSGWMVSIRSVLPARSVPPFM